MFSEGTPTEIRREDLDLMFLGSHISSALMQLEELDSCINILPTVDSDGYSECSFADELYLKKETKDKELREKLAILQAYETVLEEEIERSRESLRTISQDAGRVDNEDAKQEYHNAQYGEEKHLEDLIGKRKHVAKVISEINQMLTNSAQWQYPVEIPQRDPTVPYNTSGFRVSAGIVRNFTPRDPPNHAARDSKKQNSGNTSREEIDELISMGPSSSANPIKRE